MEEKKGEDFITESKNFFNYYKKEVGKFIRAGKNVIFLHSQEISSFSPILAEQLMSSPEEIIQVMELALEESGLVVNPRIRLLDLPEMQFVHIRNIRAKHLNSLISIEGLVRQASDVRPQVVNAKFECPSCGTIISVLQIDKKFREPSRCSCGRKGQFNLVSKEMVDAQRIVIEESPENLTGGEQPRRISVFLKEDLVEPKMEEKTTPGSRVRVIGVLKEVPVPLQTGAISTRFDLAVEANNVIPLEETFQEFDISEEDEMQIKELASDKNLIQKMIGSIAPSIYGYEEIKEVLVFQLFGGVKKKKADGGETRGDIHVLLVGDPGVAKSQLLKFMSTLAPKGRYIVGSATSGAGITATVVRDEFLKGWSLEAGAMVLANKGLICVDEIDKMGVQDRSAMHEALEQQTVTISKANVQACYSEDTEVLTETGWKHHSEVKNEKIAQYNPFDKTIRFLPHKGVYIYDYNGKMYHFNNESNDIFVTPNHKMLAREFSQKNLKAIEAQNLDYNYIKFINSGRFIGTETKYFIIPGIKHKQKRIHPKYTHQHKEKNIPMNLWLEFLGYYLTEGGIETAPTIGIVQKKGRKSKKIRECLKKLTETLGCSLSEINCGKYIRYKITQTQLYEYLKNLGEKCYFKKSCLNFSLLSPRQLKILFDAMMLGDGSSDNKYFSVTSKKLADEFQIIAHLIGKSAPQNIHYKENYRKNRKTMFRISLSDKTEPSIRKKQIKIKDYTGKVFCFSTETGFFVTRRNGKIAIQGNTLRAETSLLAAANPKLGRFEPFQVIAQQIDMPPTLINRFDIIFTLRDMPDRARDDALATHLLLEHKKEGKKQIIDSVLFRKYIAYAKQKINPELSNDAVDELKKFYVNLRNAPVSAEGAARPVPISARQLDGLIRLSEASARARLSKKVKKEDALRAITLMKFYLMQVGYDYETKTFDIDRIATGVSTSQRSRVILVREALSRLESRMGKLIPIEELEKELEEKMSKDEISDSIQRLKQTGDIFEPKKGYVQRV